MKVSRRALILAWAVIVTPLVVAMAASAAAFLGVDVPRTFWDVLLGITPYCGVGALVAGTAGWIAGRGDQNREPEVPNPARDDPDSR